MPLPRLLLLAAGAAVLACAAALDARADEAFDADAETCALAVAGHDAPDDTEGQHLVAASIRGRCLHEQALLAEAEVRSDLLVTLDSATRRALKRRRKAFAPLLLATARLEAFASLDGLTDVPPGFGTEREESLRTYLVQTTDLRYLGLASFRGAWQHVLSAAERRRDRVLAFLDDELRSFAVTEGADETPSGAKVAKLAKLAGVLVAEMDTRRAALAISVDALPEFAAEEDAAAARRRKRFKGLGAEYGDLLIALARVATRVRVRAAAAREELLADRCTPAPGEHFGAIGGGWLRYVRDGGAERIEGGETTVSFEEGQHALFLGSRSVLSEVAAYVRLDLEGVAFARTGTHAVTGYPQRGPDGNLHDFVAGEFYEVRTTGLDVRHVVVGGSVTIDVLRLDVPRKRRLIEGSFDVKVRRVGSSTETHLTGSFHLCRFQIEGDEGLY